MGLFARPVCRALLPPWPLMQLARERMPSGGVGWFSFWHVAASFATVCPSGLALLLLGFPGLLVHPPDSGSCLLGPLDSRVPPSQPKFPSSSASCTRFFNCSWRPTCRINVDDKLCRISMARFVFSQPCKSAVAFCRIWDKSRKDEGPALPNVPNPIGRKPQPLWTNSGCCTMLWTFRCSEAAQCLLALSADKGYWASCNGWEMTRSTAQFLPPSQCINNTSAGRNEDRSEQHCSTRCKIPDLRRLSANASRRRSCLCLHPFKLQVTK